MQHCPAESGRCANKVSLGPGHKVRSSHAEPSPCAIMCRHVVMLLARSFSGQWWTDCGSGSGQGLPLPLNLFALLKAHGVKQRTLDAIPSLPWSLLKLTQKSPIFGRQPKCLKETCKLMEKPAWERPISRTDCSKNQ